MGPKSTRNCSCKSHEKYSGGGKHSVFRIRGTKVHKRKTVELLIKHGDLFKHSTFLCTGCATYAEQNLNDECSAEENLSKMVQFIVENISRVNKNDLKKLATSIGISQRQPILDDIKHTDCVKIENQLCNFNIQDWLHSRNEVLKSFVDGIAGTDDKIAKTAALDSLYYAVNPRFVSPLAFTRNLLVYFQTGSKSAVDILSYGTPSGSYYLITQWLKENAKSPLECQKEHDVVTFFDNNQVLQRKWNVQVNYKTQCSVITNIIHLTSGSCKLQFSEELSPRHWMKFDMTERQHCYDALNKDVEECDTLFRQYRNEFIKSRLKLITSQQVVQHSSGTVHVKDFVENGTSIPSHTVASERYTFVGAEHPPKPVCCEMGEPCFENPCSYEAIQMVFNHIIEKTDVGKTRAWTMLGCDGLPYTLGSRLLEAIYRCECGQEYESELEFLQHREMFEHFASPVQECRKFRNLMLLPGLGHYEINMTKALFKLLWTVCLEDVGKMLGFNSPKALASCQNAADHHKSWQIIQIFFHAMADELLLPYCRASLSEGSVPSLCGYYSWLEGSCNPNYNFMLDVVFTFTFALHLFRSGVRRNNSAAIQASKHKFALLFFGLDMPNYMETYVRDSFVRLQCPPSVLAYLDENQSYSITGNTSKGEGGDFILESKNRKTKMCLPPGIPDKQKWINACQNIDRVQQIKDHFHGICDTPEPDMDFQYSCDISEEIAAFRIIIRNKKYVFDPFTETQHTTLSGEPLHLDLVNFKDTCKRNKDIYLQTIVQAGLAARSKTSTIILTNSDDKKIKTKAELINIIEKQLQLPQNHYLQTKWKQVKRKTKPFIVEFMEELESIHVQ